MTGCFSLLWGHSSEALAARGQDAVSLLQVLAQQAPVLPRDPLQAASGRHSALGRASFLPSLPSGGGGGSPGWAHTCRHHHSPDESQPSPRPATQMGLESSLASFPVKPHPPRSQVPMVTLLRCRDDHCPRLTPGALTRDAFHTTFQK